MLPHVLDEISQAGVTDQDIIIVAGLGVHRPHSEEEKKQLVGPEVFTRVKCIDSFGQKEDFVQVGKSSKGTPFQVFRPLVEATKVCIGNIDYHYFARHSGRAGDCSQSPETIQ